MKPARIGATPGDLRAPSQEVWDRLSAEERARVVDSLPSEIERATPPEGDVHLRSKWRALEALDEFFRRTRRRVYLSSELPVYYPDEPMFAPDLIAVLDVDPHERMRWVVSAEGKGLDFALEVHVSGDARKDLERNVERFARLKIPEYFVYQPLERRLRGWRLPEEGYAYQSMVPRAGRWSSSVLGLDLVLEEGRLRFYHGSAPLLEARELIGRLEAMLDRTVRRAEEESRRAEEESRRAEEESRRAEEESRRADKLAARLRELGVDPDAID